MFKSILLTKTRYGAFAVLGIVLLFTTQIVWGKTADFSDLLQFELTGRNLYNRPLFGSEPPFVTYGGDLPAFAVSGGWFGGKLGNLHLVIMMDDDNFAVHEA